MWVGTNLILLAARFSCHVAVTLGEWYSECVLEVFSLSSLVSFLATFPLTNVLLPVRV